MPIVLDDNAGGAGDSEAADLESQNRLHSEASERGLSPDPVPHEAASQERLGAGIAARSPSFRLGQPI